MTNATPTAAAEWKSWWPLVLACSIGYAMSTVIPRSIGLFMVPMSEDLGWSRTEISAGIFIAATMSIFLTPIGGAMVDRWGSRSLAIPGIILTSLAAGSYGLVQSVPQWLFLWGVFALVATTVRLNVWTAAVSNIFVAGRGLAVAMVVAGTALAGVVGPPTTNYLIDALGWRYAFMVLAAIWGVVALLLTVFFLIEPRYGTRRNPAERLVSASEPVRLLPGLTMNEALRSAQLWLIGAATLIFMIFSSAIILHEVPILVDAGVDKKTAAYLASLSAFCGFAGKLIVGWLMDRVNAARLSGLILASASFGLVFLLEPFRTPWTIFLAVLIIGGAGGAALQITTYLTVRYAGQRNFGKIFGLMLSLISIAAGFGPLLAGATFDHFHSYSYFLIAAIPAGIVAGALVFFLGPAPVFENANAHGERASAA